MTRSSGFPVFEPASGRSPSARSRARSQGDVPGVHRAQREAQGGRGLRQGVDPEIDYLKAVVVLPGSSPAVDYHGYFPADRGELDRGAVRCPGCGSELRLVNRRGVRTIWVPIMTTEADQDRPIIQEHKVWEVETS
ncbi:hypothetical protein [Microbispora sp. NPDC046933]|uniref:hypothetical protein n=1 Tax=Microbispora sp. NPDC046933 TaxID=3155618 RepID=UPI0033D6E4FA